MTRTVTTGDGSQTLWSEQAGEHYHSRFGAITESRHVFLEAGLKSLTVIPNPVHVLEIGFGTGLNALLTLSWSQESGTGVEYTAFEPFPIGRGTWNALEYPDTLGRPDLHAAWSLMHEAEMGSAVEITPSFRLLKHKEKVENTEASEEKVEVIYFDPFSPEAQPEIWTDTVFRKLYTWLKPGGLLVTYCAKGEVRRGLTQAGFAVERLPGPPGKRHILRAVKGAVT